MSAISKTITSCFAALGAMGLLAPTAAADEIVEINRTHVLKLPAPAAAVLIGDPDIADVSVFSDDTLFLLGRGYGETDLVVMDANGNVMLQTNVIIVDPAEGARVNLIVSNTERQSYHCRPYCRPAPRKGDDRKFIAGFGNTDPASTSAGATTSAPSAGGPGVNASGQPIQEPIAGGAPGPNSGPF